MKKLREITRKICIMALLIIMCQSSFSGIYSVIAVENENNSANTANATNTENETQKAYMANGGKIGNFTIFKKGEEKNNVVQNLNVFCVQKGAPMSGGTFLYNGYNWNYDSEVFKDEESYKKFTWIKDNFWEEIGASKDNKYTTEQKLEIIKTVDKDTTITADDINKVYDSENEKHKLYQYIAWTYTKKVSNFNVDNESTINAYLGGKNTSLYKVYKAIRNLADAYFNNTDPMSINITQNEEIKYDETRSAYIWKLTVNNTFPLPYNKTLKVDGQAYEDFTYDGEELVINNIDQNGVHSFEFFVDTFRITSGTAYIWKNQYKQNLTEIKTKLEPGQDKIDSNAGEVGTYSLNIKKVDDKDNSKVDNMQFKVTKQDQSQIYTTDASGIAKIAESQNIESSNGKYTYTIEEISEVDSKVADKTNVKKYVKLKNPITINLIPGVMVKDNIYVRYISAASFENGKNEIEASLINGKKVTLKLETATDTNDDQNTIVTLTIPNKEKEYDLALTKTILVSNNNLVEQFDMNLDGRIDISDATLILTFVSNNSAGSYSKYYEEGSDNYIEDTEVSKANEEIGIELDYAKAILGYFRNEISDEVARDKYNYLDSTYIIKKIMSLDTSKDKKIDIGEANQILTIYAQNSSGMDMDRINFINTNYLNTSEENETAIYNLNKVTYKVKKSDIIKYKITVYNEGNYNAKDIQITDYLPEGLAVCDENGNVDTDENGNVRCKYNNKEYVWNINGKTATTTINDTINAYTDKNLDTRAVYITCKLEDNVDVGRILYNVAEISSSNPVDDDGNEITIKDRDSDENSLSTVDDLIEEYKNNFEIKVPDKDSGNVNKDEYNYQDDDDFERIIIVEDSEFDLALRKSITKIGKSKDTMETKDRLPEINEQSAEVCAQYGTGEYNHGKEFILVERNDYIEYTIRIYNEGKDGDYAGYAKQITDYLPEGISFYAMVDADGSWITELNEGKYVTTPNNFGYYKATYDETNNKVVIDCIDTPALETKNNLATLVNIDKDKIQSYYKDSGSLSSIAYGYQEIKLICKVSETAENLKLLTNLAEITKSVAINNGVEDENIPERDSQYANITINNTSESNLSNYQVNLNTYYEERDVSDEDYSYYPGLQDDDDFETVKIECVPGTFNIKLIKYIKGTTDPLAGAIFKITVNDGVQDVYSKDNLVTNEEGIIELEEEIDINKEGTIYTITVEENGVPEGYIGLSESITFTAVSRINGSKLELTPDTLTVDNAKKVEINPGDILIEAENKPEPVIHKGVKTVENQDSGYYKNEKQTWVINSTIPAGISEYTKYIILDEMDPEITKVEDKRLVFLGTENLHIKIKGEEQELVAGTDYKVNFDEEKQILEITFIDEESSFTAGKNLQEGSILEIKYDTKFALNDDGSIKGINQSIPNQAILKYNVGTPDDTTKESEKPEVHTGGVGIFKYDVKTKKALEGAHFKITRSLEKNANGEYDFIKVKDKDGIDTNVDLEVVTGSDGKAVFEGLEFGEDAIIDATNKQADGTYKYDWTKAKTEYYIIETQTPEEYLPLEKPIQVTVKYDSFDIADLTKYYQVGNKPKIYDLSLRKFITQVEDKKITNREPNVILTDEFKDEENDNVTTAKYEHTKEPVMVVHGNIVTYTMRVYNEGLEDAYASLIKDDIPEGLEFVQYTEGDGSINDKYGWKLVDENDNEVTDPSKAKYIITDYLSMENGKINEDGSNSNLLKGFNSKTMDKLDYRDVEVQFKVTEPEKSERTITNYAQISKMTNSNGKVVIDRDSTPNAWVEGEDDQDIENIKLSYFDLALRKWVTEAIVIQDGKKVVTHTGHKAEDNPEAVVKVDLKKSKVDSVEVKFAYKIRVTNEGKIGGYAKEVTDHIPDGLKFVQEDNPNWTLVDDKTITTDELKDVYLEHGESAEVTVVLTWINSKTNLGIKNNIAEISKDENEYGAHDVDSTPGNYKWGEDDIDDAPVMLAIKTGNEMIKYTMLGLAVITVLGIGINLVKRTKFI
ncbi:MAG: isopeptide-forming domain-containing fimbrial protein [Clostridia bacterium]|nr:isopeptide-forming domain-containing fimbrial protein [Clostridia bacterium]